MVLRRLRLLGLGGTEPKLRDLCATVREIVADLTGFKRLMDERKETGDGRFTTLTGSIDRAVSQLEKQTATAFSAAEKATDKYEGAQKEYNNRSNEFRAALDDQNKLMMPRTEVESLVRGLREMLDSGKAALAEHVIADQASHALAMPRMEAVNIINSIESKLVGMDGRLSDLRESRSKGEGKEQQHSTGISQLQWFIVLGVSIAGLLIAGAAMLTGVFLLFTRISPLIAHL